MTPTGLFSKKPPTTAHPVTPGPTVRSGGCLYEGEPFPRQGELINVGYGTAEFLLDRDDLPDRWSDLVEAIRAKTGEPAEDRVYVNLTGMLFAMMTIATNKFRNAIGLAAEADTAQALLLAGNNSLAECRAAFPQVHEGWKVREAFDFETIKWSSALTHPASVEQRQNAGWPYPEVWRGDLDNVRFPA